MALERASIGDVQAVGLALSDLQESLSSAQETRLLESVPANFLSPSHLLKLRPR